MTFEYMFSHNLIISEGYDPRVGELFPRGLNKKVALAIPIQTALFQEIQKEYKTQIKTYQFVQASRRLIQEVGYREEDDLYSCLVAEVLEMIDTFRKEKKSYKI